MLWSLIAFQSGSDPSYITIYEGNRSYSATLSPGKYNFSCWGAQGGRAYSNGALAGLGGKGAYTTGLISLEKNTTFYFYVGGRGVSAVSGLQLGGFNGGGTSGFDAGGLSGGNDGSGSGGGASDIRINQDNVENRIMVAAGGSGGADTNHGCPGGTLHNVIPTGYGKYSETDDSQAALPPESLSRIKAGGGLSGQNNVGVPGSGGGGGFVGGIGGTGEQFNSFWRSVGHSGTSYISSQPPAVFEDPLMERGDGPNGRENDGKIIVQLLFLCPFGCTQCPTADTCIKCLPDFTLNGSKCYQNCGDDQYQFEQVCRQCNSTCSSCFDGTPQSCLSCPPGTYLLPLTHECITEERCKSTVQGNFHFIPKDPQRQCVPGWTSFFSPTRSRSTSIDIVSLIANAFRF